MPEFSSPGGETSRASQTSPALPVQVSFPESLRSCTEGWEHAEFEAGDVTEAVEMLFQRFPLLRARLFDPRLRLRPRVLMYFDERSL